MPSIFSKIIAGQIPAEFVFQDDLWVAILDIRPSAPGHSLLIPRAEGQHLTDLPAATLAAVGDRLARLSAAVKAASGAPAVNIALNDGPAAGQEVPHAHFHVIPRFPGDGRRLGWPGTPYADGELKVMAGKLRAGWR